MFCPKFDGGQTWSAMVWEIKQNRDDKEQSGGNKL